MGIYRRKMNKDLPPHYSIVVVFGSMIIGILGEFGLRKLLIQKEC